MSGSNVAQLRKRIGAEIEAMNHVFHRYAAVTQHHIIEHKYAQLGVYQAQLTELIGPTAAIEILIQELNERTSNLPLAIQEGQCIKCSDLEESGDK